MYIQASAFPVFLLASKLLILHFSSLHTFGFNPQVTQQTSPTSCSFFFSFLLLLHQPASDRFFLFPPISSFLTFFLVFCSPFPLPLLGSARFSFGPYHCFNIIFFFSFRTSTISTFSPQCIDWYVFSLPAGNKLLPSHCLNYCAYLSSPFLPCLCHNPPSHPSFFTETP